jgi:hypothetical protein
MNLEQIQHVYPNQWVIIEFTELDDELKVIEGKVIATAKDRLEIEKKLADFRNKKLAVEYTGSLDTEEGYLL